jgi:hypothetical protein
VISRGNLLYRIQLSLKLRHNCVRKELNVSCSPYIVVSFKLSSHGPVLIRFTGPEVDLDNNVTTHAYGVGQLQRLSFVVPILNSFD